MGAIVLTVAVLNASLASGLAAVAEMIAAWPVASAMRDAALTVLAAVLFVAPSPARRLQTGSAIAVAWVAGEVAWQRNNETIKMRDFCCEGLMRQLVVPPPRALAAALAAISVTSICGAEGHSMTESRE